MLTYPALSSEMSYFIKPHGISSPYQKRKRAASFIKLLPYPLFLLLHGEAFDQNCVGAATARTGRNHGDQRTGHDHIPFGGLFDTG